MREKDNGFVCRDGWDDLIEGWETIVEGWRDWRPNMGDGGSVLISHEYAI